MVESLTEDTFKKVITGPIPVIIDFWASWCGPCTMLAPIFEEASKKYHGKLQFAKISTEDFPEIAEEIGIIGIPCLIIFKNGSEVDRIVGFHPMEMLVKKIDGILARI
ncbi:MAG: thioredoxin [Nanoarchaeota archaeon]|nr:thioredoxin [Nanoarchaeota archaeon]